MISDLPSTHRRRQNNANTTRTRNSDPNPNCLMRLAVDSSGSSISWGKDAVMNLLSEPALRMLKLLTTEWIAIPTAIYERGQHVWNELYANGLSEFSHYDGGCWVRLTKEAAPYNPSVFN